MTTSPSKSEKTSRRETDARDQVRRPAPADEEVSPVIRQRWSPYAFSTRPVDSDDLAALFEAARWAASSRNEQPWRFAVADDPESEDHARFVELLSSGNRDWARRAPVLVLTFVKTTFGESDRSNRVAHHDLGQAVAQMTAEATARGLACHQMAGIRRDAIAEAFDLPEDVEPVTGIAIGYPARPDEAPEELLEKDRGERSRRPREAFVFGGRWGQPWSGD